MRDLSLLALLVVTVGCTASKEPSAPEAAATPSVDDLIEQLGDENYRVRKAATEQLTEIGEPALDDLRHAAYNGRGNFLSAANPVGLTSARASRWDPSASWASAAPPQTIRRSMPPSSSNGAWGARPLRPHPAPILFQRPRASTFGPCTNRSPTPC